MKGFLRRLWRFHLDPNRLTSETVRFGNKTHGTLWRITKRRGKIVGIERWEATEHYDPVWMYTLWKKEGLSDG